MGRHLQADLDAWINEPPPPPEEESDEATSSEDDSQSGVAAIFVKKSELSFGPKVINTAHNCRKQKIFYESYHCYETQTVGSYRCQGAVKLIRL